MADRIGSVTKGARTARSVGNAHQDGLDETGVDPQLRRLSQEAQAAEIAQSFLDSDERRRPVVQRGAPRLEERFEDAYTGSGATGESPGFWDSGSILDTGVEWLRGLDPLKRSVDTNIDGSKRDVDQSHLRKYLDQLGSRARVSQAEDLLNKDVQKRPPSLGDAGIEEGTKRSQVIEAAASAYSLTPSLVAGFILAEQRDQSKLEDDVEATFASWGTGKGLDTGLGLGQVRMQTARTHSLLDDTVEGGTASLDDEDLAKRLLYDEEANIYATAKFIRHVADQGAVLAGSDPGGDIAAKAEVTKSGSASPDPAAVAESARNIWEDFDASTLSEHAEEWTRGNIKAVASEYTSRQWDGNWAVAWGDFVAEACDDAEEALAILAKGKE